jgi:probable rRNA maturation factor
LLRPGDHAVFQSDIYGGTHHFVVGELPRYGIEVSLVDDPTPEGFAKAVRPHTRLLYVESPSNPLLRVVDIAESGELNARYRGREGPTNVLSFPADDQMLDYRCLGDLVICAPLVVEEAGSRNLPVEAHWAHLVVHGMLHLQGYDHEDAGQAAIMEGLEVEILGTLGYANPYNERDLSRQ